MVSRLDWPVRTISFSHDTRVIASASEDPFIDIASTFTGKLASTFWIMFDSVYSQKYDAQWFNFVHSVTDSVTPKYIN